MSQAERRGPRGHVGHGKPGRNFRRWIREILALHPLHVTARSVARQSGEGRAWLARKAGR